MHNMLREKYYLFVLSCFILFFIYVPMMSARPILNFTTHAEPDSYAFTSTNLLLTEAFHRLGYDFSLQTLPGKRSLHEANKGVFVGEAHRFGNLNDNNDFPNLIKVPEIQQVISNAIYSKRIIHIDKPWQQLANYTVAVPRGSIWITSIARQYAKKVQEISTLEQILNCLKYDRTDVAIMPTETADIIKTKEFKDIGIKQVSPILSRLEIYTFIHKNHEELVPKLASTLRQMKQDGSYQRLLADSDK